MTVRLEISDSCPHCGQLVAVRLTAAPPIEQNAASVSLFVDPSTAELHAVAPWADHPCPEERQS